MRTRKDFKYIVIGGSLLSANAGFINTVFLVSSIQLAVAHVTGTVSKASVDLGSGNLEETAEVFVIWASFYIGAFISGLLIRTEQFALGHAYGRALLLMGCLLCVSAYFLSNYGNNARLASLCPAAMALGLQNAMTTRFSGAVIRTTHLTGMTTDLGLLTAHWIQGQPEAPLWRFKLFVPQILCFFFGGALGAFSHRKLGDHVLYVPAFFTGLLGLSYITYLSRRFRRSFLYMLTRSTEGVEKGTAEWMRSRKSWFGKRRSVPTPADTIVVPNSHDSLASADYVVTVATVTVPSETTPLLAQPHPSE